MYLDEISELGLRLACSIARPAAVRVSSALDTVAMLSTHFGQSGKKIVTIIERIHEIYGRHIQSSIVMFT